MARKFGMRFFGGIILVQGLFWVLIFVPIPSPLSPEIRSTPSGLEFSCIRTLSFSHFPSQVNLYFSDWKLCGGEQWKNHTFLKPSNASKIVGENNTAEILALTGIFVGFNSGPKVPFPGVLHISQFHFPQMKPYKLVDYFIKVSFHIVVDMRQGECNIFQISTWKAFLLLKIYLLWKIRPISVKRWKTVWIRACPIPGPNCPLGESPTTSHCQVECWHVWLWK